MFLDADSSSKQCTGIYPAQLVGGRWPPSPQCIGVAASDAQAAVGVCWYIWAGKNCTSGAAPGGRTAAVGSTTTSHRLVVSKCAFSRGPTKRTERPGHPRTLPPFGSLLLVDHRLSSLCHSATNEPSANVYLGGETTLYTIHLKRKFSKRPQRKKAIRTPCFSWTTGLRARP